MLTFRTTNIALTLFLGLLLWADLQYDISFWYYVLLFFIYSLVLFWGCYAVGSNFFIHIICSSKTQQKEIALSFDDGPAAQYTPEILALLKRNNIQAAFFCIGKRISGNEALLQQIYHEGHVIGNHSYSHHAFFDLFSASRITEDLRLMDEATRQTIGVQPALFRPPYGVTNPNVKKAILNRGYTPVGWSIRSLDTVIKDPQKLQQRVSRAVKPGDIILFHDTSKTTLDILQRFIDGMRQQGYTFARLDKMLNIKPYV